MVHVAVKRVEVPPHAARPAPPPVRRPIDPSADFAEYVRARVQWPVLRYPQRVALLKEAQRRGVGRFEANLVIAQVLHQEGLTQSYEMRPKSGWVGLVAAAALVQGGILIGFWWMAG